MYDPYLSDWENTVENARRRENELRAIESKREPPPKEAKTFNYESLADTIFFAESLGFSGDWEDQDADAHEIAAIEHIESAGYKVKWE
jgi:hypothetical protein